MKHRLGPYSLRGKLNILILGIILIIATGLMSIAYYVFCQKVDDDYNQRLENAAYACANNVVPEQVEYFWNVIRSDEFLEVQKRAAAEENEKILLDWMESQPSYFEAAYARETEADDQAEAAEELENTDEQEEKWTLLDDYEQIIAGAQAIIDYLNVDSAYYQIDINGITYNIADPEKDLLYVGTEEIPLEDFQDYPDNSVIPPTVYRSEFGWLCTAMYPVASTETGKAIAIAGVDINMTEIMHVRYSFLLQSLLFVLILTVLASVISMLLVNHIAVNPLQRLAQAATGFAKENEGDAFSKEDVIELNIHSRDEIGDLYREIRSMQSRIVDYTQNLTQVTAERERVNTELRTATQIQEAMLPSRFPAFPERKDFDLYARMDPAKEVGGDFYDFFLIDDDHLAMVIADVSDKGVPAALFMMSSKILISYRAKMGGSPSEILTAVNDEIAKNSTMKMFVTVWLGILELSTGKLTCANAGHEYPVFRGQDGVFRLLKDKHGLVVGAMKGIRYRDYEVQMLPGDAVFVYTDGVPEASNMSDEFYGMERMQEALNRLADRSPREILDGIRADVDAFAGDARQFDDLTMLCLEYRGEEKQH